MTRFCRVWKPLRTPANCANHKHLEIETLTDASPAGILSHAGAKSFFGLLLAISGDFSAATATWRKNWSPWHHLLWFCRLQYQGTWLTWCDPRGGKANYLSCNHNTNRCERTPPSTTFLAGYLRGPSTFPPEFFHTFLPVAIFQRFPSILPFFFSSLRLHLGTS